MTAKLFRPTLRSTTTAMRTPEPLRTFIRDVSVGCAAAGAAALLQWSLQPWLGTRAPFLFFLPTMIFIAASVGRLPAGIVLIAGALCASLGASGSGAWSLPGPADERVTALYLIVGCVVIGFGERFQLRRARAQQAESRLTLAQDETGVGLFELDYRAGTAYASPALCQILGQPVMNNGSMPLQRWLSLLDAGHVEDSRRALQAKIEAGELRYEREMKIELPDGRHRWLLSRIRLELDAAGQLATSRGATLDITARKQLVAELQQTQEQLRQRLNELLRLHALSNRLLAMPDVDAALQATLDAAVSFHGATVGMLWCFEPGGAKRLAAHHGLDVAQRGLLEAPETAEQICTSATSRRHRESVVDLREDARFSKLHPIADALGLCSLHTTPLVGSVAGRVLGVMAVLSPQPAPADESSSRLGDLCAAQACALIEREQALLLAREVQLRFDAALHSSSAAFTILAPVRERGGRVVDFSWRYANPAAAALLGHPAETLVGQRVLAVLPHAWNEPGTFERYCAVLERGEATEFEFEVREAEGSRWLHIILSPLNDSVIVWFSDVTERHRHEEMLQQADRRKDEFLAMLAHELRNPLAPALQGVKIARSPAASDAQRQWGHAVIERQLRHMALLLDDLLDVSRITRGALALRRSSVELGPIIDSAVEMARPLLDSAQHQLMVTLPDSSVWLDADPLRLAQVLGNLLTNAAKYTDARGRIELAAVCSDEALVLSVSDNGIGLSAADCGRVFEMFTQLSDSRGHAPVGLGIGLSLSRALVQLHGGELTVASAGRGQGSTFTLRLPQVLRAAQAAAPGLAPPQAAALRAQRRILVVDDNRDAADSLALLLSLQGNEVQVAYDGREALSLFERFRPRVAILDVGMPVHNGLEVAARIRSLQRDEPVVLIAVTGWGGRRDRQRSLQAGFDHHLTKPVMLDQLEALLD